MEDGSAAIGAGPRRRGLSGAQTPAAEQNISPRELVVQDVIRGLYEGRYRPGERLVEAKLTAIYGISRGPVREALNRLAAMGAVSLTLQRGAQVRELSLDEAVDILVVMQNLISLAARLAAEREDHAAGADDLNRILERLKTAPRPGAWADHAIARDEFYAKLIELSGNSELSRILLGLQLHLVRVQFEVATQALDRLRHADYRRIVRAIIGGKPGRAEAAARQHFARPIELFKHLKGYASLP